MENREGLESQIFQGLALASDRRYIYMSNLRTDVSRWSLSAVEHFGLPGEYMSNFATYWTERIHPDDRDLFIADIQAVVQGTKKEHNVDYRVLNRNGEYDFCTCRGSIIKSDDGKDDLFIGALENHSIRDNVDATTNLYNIFKFWEDLKETRELGITDVAVLLIGINHFSEINDMYGYAFGDNVLKEFAVQLRSHIGERARIYRMDGVRFSCCFINTSNEEIHKLYNELKRIMNHDIYIYGVRASVSISGGLVSHDSEYNIYSVLTSARYALEQSKHVYNGDLITFNNDLITENLRNLDVMEALRECIQNECDSFYLCYQPIVDADSEKLTGAEALLRWNKEPFGNVPPGIFIPWLENDPCFYDLGCWIMRKAMIDCLPIIEKFPDFILNINIAYTQISRHYFRDSVVEILEETGFPAENLCLELTERCRIIERNYLKNEVDFLRNLGIHIALDDFGTGFASLEILNYLEVDTMKIDRGFVKDIQTNMTCQAIVGAITGCAHQMNIKVCMEGVEDRDLINFVKKYPIYSYQGYYFSRPIVLDEFYGKYLH